MASHQLFTTGYSGHDPSSFVNLLRDHEVDAVIDVRRNPVSRKKGFSRTALSEFLGKKKVEYLHFRDLGVPQALRQELRDGSCDLQSYLVSFREYLQDQSVALDEVYKIATKKRCCLLCVEECSNECHRSVVADELACRNGRKIKIVHI